MICGMNVGNEGSVPDQRAMRTWPSTCYAPAPVVPPHSRPVARRAQAAWKITALAAHELVYAAILRLSLR